MPTDNKTTKPKLTSAQKKAIYPGPGNPDYARGSAATMRVLERLGLVKQVRTYPVQGERSALLTPTGALIRKAMQNV